jgi:uncharacterized RmlC-like cupin family protein
MKIHPTMLAAIVVAISLTTAIAAERRLTPADMAELTKEGAGAGSSGVVGVQTAVLSGNPTDKGLYTIKLSVPANTRIQSHTHQDERSAIVVSGMWRFGYGKKFEEGALKVLPPGSFYIEPAGVAHFTETRAERVTVYITGIGPTDTVYVESAADPRHP